MGFDPVTLGVMGAVTSAAGSVVAGAGAAQGAAADAGRLKTAAVLSAAKADETDTRMREELMSTLGNIRAVRAAAGVNLDSPGEIGIEGRQRFLSERDIATQRANAAAEISADTSAASQKMQGARMSLISGGIGALGSLGSSLSGVYRTPRLTQ